MHWRRITDQGNIGLKNNGDAYPNRTSAAFLRDGGICEMKKAENNNAVDRMKIEVNGKKINLIFQREPNVSAAEFIKKTLISAYTLKAV